MTASATPVRRMLGSLYGLMHARLELIGIELADEKERLLGVLFLGLITTLFGTLALVCLTALVAILFWDTYRWQALAALTAIYALIALVCALKARASIRGAPGLFDATLNELDKDRAMLGSIMSDTAQ